MANLVRQLGKNVFSSASSLGVRVILVFLVNPFIIHTLGDDQYGVWVLVISIINYMTILDLGLKQALIRFISKYLGLKDYLKINSILNTAFLIYSLIGIFIVILTLILSFFALDWFNIPEEFISQGRMVLIIIGISTAINFMFVTWGDSLGAFHRFDVSYGILIAEDILRTIAIIFLLKNGYGLVPFALAYMVFNLLKNLAGAGFLKKLVPEIKFGFKYASKLTLNEIFNYSLIAFFISIAWILIVNLDNVLIGYFLDTASVTQYAIAAGFIVYLKTLILTVSFPLRPLISHYESVGRTENIKYIYTGGTKYLYYLTFAIGGGALIYSDTFIHLWMGEGYEAAAMILKILIIPAAVALPQMVAFSVMYGVDRHKNLFYIILVEGLLNLILSIVLVRYYGLNGIAYGTVIPQVLIYIFVIPVIIRSILKIRLGRFYMSMIKSILTAVILSAGLSYVLKSQLPPDGWALFFGEIIIIGSITIALGYFLADREELKSIIRKFRNV